MLSKSGELPVGKGEPWHGSEALRLVSHQSQAVFQGGRRNEKRDCLQPMPLRCQGVLKPRGSMSDGFIQNDYGKREEHCKRCLRMPQGRLVSHQPQFQRCNSRSSKKKGALVLVYPLYHQRMTANRGAEAIEMK